MGKLRSTRMAKILEVREENPRMRTIVLELAMNASPGQFLMVWIPGLDEKPMSISHCGEGRIGITAAKVGPFSERLHQMKAGELLGIRGPFGNGFRFIGERVAVVGGGCGTAPLAFLVEELAKKGKKVFFINGAKTKGELFFVERARNVGAEVIVCTDDGSEGRKGFTTDALVELLGKERIDCVYTCGPEIMMRKIVDLCLQKKIECQASLERWMKCGFGICGQCAIDGMFVCKDGPVFPMKKLSKLKEFGSLKRDACGSEMKV